MSSKYYEYMNLLQLETFASTQSMENWSKYLDGAARNFKYSFSEQLLINSQKPDATAIADYDTWKNRLGRTVKTGTAMYIPVVENGKARVKNYFDISDTIATHTSQLVPHWGISEVNQQAVLEHLAANYDLSEPGKMLEIGSNLENTLNDIYGKSADSYVQNNIEAINTALEGSSLHNPNPNLDDKYNRELAFETVVYASVAIIVNKRLGLGIESDLSEELLENLIKPYLHHFNTEQSIIALGNAVSSISEECLRHVETAVKSFDREQQKQLKIQKERDFNEQRVYSGSNERDDLLRAAEQAGNGSSHGENEGGRHDVQQMGISGQRRPMVHDGSDGRERPDNQNAVSQHSDGRTAETADPMGHGENGLSQGIQQISGDAVGNRGATQALSGDSGSGHRAQAEHDGSHTERPGQQSYEQGQKREPDGVGGQDEQLSGAGTRNDLQRPDLRLSNQGSITEEAPIGVGAFSMPEEAATDDLGAFSAQKIPPMFVIDWEEVKYDFDLNLYEDGDMVAYNEDGVSFKVGKTGDLTYITSATSITPMGDILGDRNIPSYVRRQMRAYHNGDITAEQVREETLQRLDSYRTSFETALANGSTIIQSLDAPVELEQSTAEYPASLSHSPLLKGWYDVLGQNEELTLMLARVCNEEALLPVTSARPRRQLEPFFARITAPVLAQSKLTDAAFDVFYNELLKENRIEKQVSLSIAHLGHGLSVSNRLYEDDEGDYEKLAHIDFDRDITWYYENLPEDLRARIINTAETSTTDYFVSLDIHSERKEWLSMINDMVSVNGFITKEDFAYTPFDGRGGLAKFVALYGLEGYERVLNRINKEALPHDLDNIHEHFKKQYPDRLIAVSSSAGFVDVRNIPADTGLSTTVKEGSFSRRISGKEYGDLLSKLREKNVPAVTVYPESGQIFTHNPDKATAREIEQTLSQDENNTHNGKPLQPNERIESVDGVDFVIKTVRNGEQLTLDASEQTPAISVESDIETSPPPGNKLSGVEEDNRRKADTASELFARQPDRNINADMPGKYSDTYFRIDKNGYDSSGREDWSESTRTAYENEVSEILTANGWDLQESNRSGAAVTATKGKNFLYLHPQNFSGVCENSEREKLFE
ncbi:MAG: hypothetical protein FWF79_01220, partial [Defluviitaleaceae bacterium]|nr:hypothetical protein [Defluviitaleaceae bacterium]